jgi:hypothetical protein
MPAAYQDENGKWWKECSETKEVFGPVDNKEDLSEWFFKDKSKKDGFHQGCKDAGCERRKEYYENNKEEQNEKSKKYRENNREKVREKRKEYYENNKEEQKEKVKNYYHNNIEKRKEYSKSPRGMLNHYRSKAKIRGINFNLTLDWTEEQIKLPEYNICAISGIQFVEEPHHAFSRSLDRIDSSKGYTPDNVRWVCYKLNSWKSDLTLHEVSLIFKYMSESYGYDPIEYLRETIQKVS